MRFLIAVLFSIPAFLFAGTSNLILNPGFENFDSIRKIDTPVDSFAFRHVEAWYNPTLASPDFFYLKDGKNGSQGSFKNENIVPKSGMGYAGFIGFWDIPIDYREYIGGKLVEPLTAGKTYKFSMHIARSIHSSYSMSQIEVYFSNAQSRERTSAVITHFAPQLTITIKNCCKTKDEWVEISGYYTAMGGESFFILGNFKQKPGKLASDTLAKAPPSSGLIYAPPNSLLAYYFVDDLTLVEVDKKNITLPLSDTLAITPGKKITINSIYFQVNDSTISANSFGILDEIVEAMKKQPNLKVEIYGHTDNSGSYSENMKLSEARARSVANYLIAHGINPQRITTKGYGSTKPISTSDQVKNRRVEFVFSE